MKGTVVSLLIITMVVQTLPETTSPDWQDFNDRSYYFDSNVKSWFDAESECRGHKGHLASIHSFPEHRFIQTLIKKVAGEGVTTWLGGNSCQESGVWLWTDGSPLDYTYWAEEHPAEGRCLTMSQDDGLLWADESCDDTSHAYVCTKDQQ
ncbi:type-2 ice-structuring protein-like [Synchiropus splendidus]|uniref:type-2 ice-structuring protein-like n=1 Tax=Synchiropus splendidus TaxID=270530 RepID=UPI00237E8D7E|nr:type-2 ice-structuring protein-like [Synchiropus splendidus]